MECAGNLLLDYPVPDAEDTGGLCLAVQWSGSTLVTAHRG